MKLTRLQGFALVVLAMVIIYLSYLIGFQMGSGPVTAR